MAIQSRLSLVIASGALALAATAGSSPAADLAPITAVSVQVKPLAATASAGRMLFLDVFYEGVSAGSEAPVSIAGAPEGTSLKVTPVSEKQALLGLVFPSNAARGRYDVSVRIGSPEPLVEQKVAIEIEE